jgi:hypothetical protein
MSWVSVNVDLEDVYSEMNRRDKQMMSEWLYEDDILQSHTNPDIRKVVRGDKESQGESELRDNLTKIWNSYHQLTNEEEEFIKKIADRLPL